MKIFKMNECDWYAAETVEDALRGMAETMGFETTPEGIAAMRKEYDVGEPVELDDADLDRLKIRIDDPDSADGSDDDELQTFREHLAEMIADGEEFPCLFASTEF